eukprot:scaffold49486_cov57-Phaeocystis_antarctica.AAC.2
MYVQAAASRLRGLVTTRPLLGRPTKPHTPRERHLRCGDRRGGGAGGGTGGAEGGLGLLVRFRVRTIRVRVRVNLGAIRRPGFVTHGGSYTEELRRHAGGPLLLRVGTEDAPPRLHLVHRLATRLAPRLPPVARGLEQAAVQAEVREEQREYVEARAREDEDVNRGVTCEVEVGHCPRHVVQGERLLGRGGHRDAAEVGEVSAVTVKVTVGPARRCDLLATLLAPCLIAGVPVLAAHLSIAGQPSESEVARAQPLHTLAVLGAVIEFVAVSVAGGGSGGSGSMGEGLVGSGGGRAGATPGLQGGAGGGDSGGH